MATRKKTVIEKVKPKKPRTRKTPVSRKKKVEKLINIVGLVTDHSASMSGLTMDAERDFNAQINVHRDESQKSGQSTVVSHVLCGISDGWNSPTVNRLNYANMMVGIAPSIHGYRATGNSTPLFDAVGLLIDTIQKHPDIDKPNVSVLIQVVTDGGENASSPEWKNKLGRVIQQLQATDRWTFTFRVPRGGKSRLVSLGIPDDNILEWDTTSAGMQAASAATQTAVSGFYQARGLGQKSVKRFYTNLQGVSAKTMQSKLVDISHQVRIFAVPQYQDGVQIRDFLIQSTGDFVKGQGFYQLMKTERAVQEYKQIAIRDKVTGAVYAGASARHMLGLPSTGTVSVSPGDHGKYDIYIQSTSVNRKLPAGTSVLFWASAAIAA